MRNGDRARIANRHIGIGGDQIVAALADGEAEREHGDEIRAAQ